MKQLLVVIIALLNFVPSHPQDVSQRLADAVKVLENDAACKHAIISLNVVDSKTGKPVFARNAQVGLAPASCQKIFTSIAAFEILGADYRYKTVLGYDGKIEAGVLDGNLHFSGSGDPTLGSWRWDQTKEKLILQQWVKDLKSLGIKKVNGLILNDDRKWSTNTIPDGWIWQDIGNYYGAGASALNWHENQYDVKLQSGNKIGEVCEVVAIVPDNLKINLISEVTTAARGSGDNAFIYLPPFATVGYIRGTIPIGEKSFTISGALHTPFAMLATSFINTLNTSGVETEKHEGWVSYPPFFNVTPLSTSLSPSLDSINYWFLKKSINLYGEAFLKTIAFEKTGYGSTEKGIEILKNFWAQHGIENAALNIMDGCGLSPQNRVTTDALVKAMLYAKSKSWYAAFYRGLPEINGITMKSGSINGARSYTGYIKSKAGVEYTFAIMVNNYDGAASDVVRKMWKVLDVMK